MWSEALLNLFALPFLLLISIPLALSASLTAFLALTALFLRALVVYFELSIALLANFFLFTAHSPASGSLLALSRVTTPGADRSPSRTKHSYHYYHNSQANPHYPSNAKSRRGSWASKEVVAEDYFFHHNNYTGPTLMSSHEVLSSFISGNAERDFEGVGGWRTPLASRKKHLIPSASVSYNSSEGEVEDDDQAWISINKRLELPSRHFNFASPVLSPVMASAATIESIEEPQQLHRHHVQPPPSQQLQRPRFHRRSVTTPLLSMPSTTSVVSSHSSSSAEQTAISQLQTSKSSAGLDSLLSSSFSGPSASHTLLPSSSSVTTTPSWHGPPFLMTPTSFGADYRMAHYPSFISRRRRSSGGSPAAAATAKTMSLTGLGLN